MDADELDILSTTWFLILIFKWSSGREAFGRVRGGLVGNARREWPMMPTKGTKAPTKETKVPAKEAEGACNG